MTSLVYNFTTCDVHSTSTFTTPGARSQSTALRAKLISHVAVCLVGVTSSLNISRISSSSSFDELSELDRSRTRELTTFVSKNYLNCRLECKSSNPSWFTSVLLTVLSPLPRPVTISGSGTRSPVTIEEINPLRSCSCARVHARVLNSHRYVTITCRFA